jgi:ABC-type glutathione transport system ATPase component
MSSTEPLLQVEVMSVRHESKARSVPALTDISLAMETGEWLGLIGESGSGKSTLLRAILRMLPPTSCQTGRICFAGSDVATLDEAELTQLRGGSIGFMPQQAVAALNPVRTVGSQVAELFRLRLGLDSDAARLRSLELLERFHLSDSLRVYESYPHQLSGGMCQRVVLAMAMALEPRLLLADEPTSSIDAGMRLELLDEIRIQQRRRNLAVLFVSHDLELVERYADRLAMLQGGRMAMQGERQ